LSGKQAYLSGSTKNGYCKQTQIAPNLNFIDDPFKLKMMNLLMDDKIMEVKFGHDVTYTCIIEKNMTEMEDMCNNPKLQDYDLVKRFNLNYKVQKTPDESGEGSLSASKVASFSKGTWNKSRRMCKDMPVGLRLSFV
jgi:hypothetical protein